ncbi:inositol polyphosphate 1-phosphatase-like [Teleopsis dalmanni]|uniref:inositol polyphosphate 1-phosphatase-like n=1 Tax=Teleopsis dalmanni TaxID=139649 RepID=UPI000D32A232|nr:inositol polyphosphate 1-phosphatase-like [Teleopsis dalmanni]
MGENDTERNLLRSLINASEKAANIARICRSNEQLLSLLVQEKSGTEANARFEHDFKTLADVLIQETIKHDVGNLFPELRESICGEESPNFTNTLGESVTISVGDTLTNTIQCLSTVLNGNEEAAEALANEVHRDISFEDERLGDIPALPNDLAYEELGIWIDPIDATAEYISGDSMFTNFPGITSTGLDCVTVLIGVYNRLTGIPIIGVISQPFQQKIIDNEYRSLVFWGVALPDLQVNNCKFDARIRNPLGIFSSSENPDVLQCFLNLGYEIAFSAGAGHKALKVITNEVEIYTLSKAGTFRWDTCAPQAILRSIGGDIYNYSESVKQQKPIALNYSPANDNEENWKCNKGGLIAIRDSNNIEQFIVALANV